MALDERAPLAEALPRILLYLAVAGVALAVTTPASWAGPLTLVSVVAIACAALVARDRATALRARLFCGWVGRVAQWVRSMSLAHSMDRHGSSA
ncbi:hypothetical protein ACGFH9_11900, partial [Micromonospora sp. NPDC049102]